jgi:hypothetical protein
VPGDRVALVISGANIDPQVRSRILESRPADTQTSS